MTTLADIQRHVGVVPDGAWGPQTAAAIAKALGMAAPQHRRTSAAGIALIHSFESCKLDAYPDPGSRDGTPWSIGWGSTGEGIARGLQWTQAQCDERFARDLQRYERDVARAIGDAPTTQAQFDSLVSFHYNTGAISTATLTRKHKAGDYAGAAAEFARWDKNDGKVMRGLTRRRAAEAAMYRGQA